MFLVHYMEGNLIGHFRQLKNKQQHPLIHLIKFGFWKRIKFIFKGFFSVLNAKQVHRFALKR